MSHVMRRRDVLRSLTVGGGGLLIGCGGRGMDRVHADVPPPMTGVCAPTRRDVLGPYFAPNAPSRTAIARASEAGERLRIVGRVLGPDCATPLAGAVIDVWQADAAGHYYDCDACDGEDETDEAFRLRGVLSTNASGEFEVTTIKPGHYRLASGWRPAHVHFRVASPGHATLVTQLYFAGDPYLAPNDACGSGCGSDDPGRIVALRSAPGGSNAEFPIVLARS